MPSFKSERVSVGSNDTEGNNNSYNPSISGDGRYVTFSSDANNLVAGDTNGRYNDVLTGGNGNDTLVGGANADTFMLQSSSGLDRISDFKGSEDQLRLAAGFQGSLGLTESAGNTTISILGEGNNDTAIAILQGVTNVSLESLGLRIIP